MRSPSLRHSGDGAGSRRRRGARPRGSHGGGGIGQPVGGTRAGSAQPAQGPAADAREPRAEVREEPHHRGVDLADDAADDGVEMVSPALEITARNRSPSLLSPPGRRVQLPSLEQLMRQSPARTPQGGDTARATRGGSQPRSATPSTRGTARQGADAGQRPGPGQRGWSPAVARRQPALRQSGRGADRGGRSGGRPGTDRRQDRRDDRDRSRDRDRRR